MKRLVKKYNILENHNVNGKKIVKNSEFEDGFKKNDLYYELYKNPTYSEIENIKKMSKYNAVRGVIYDDGTIYAWDGDICHIYINRYFKLHPIDIDTFRFCYENDHWLIDLCGSMKLEEAYNKIYEYRNILSNFGNINNKFLLLEPFGDFYLKDYINSKNLVAKINKKI